MENMRNMGLKKNPYNQTKKKWWINEQISDSKLHPP